VRQVEVGKAGPKSDDSTLFSDNLTEIFILSE
jgi:hypothetical protein